MAYTQADAYTGEIRMFAGAFAPVGWAFCNGTLITITDNQALYSLIGTNFGGDGRVTFALPDMRGRVPVHQGIGVGLTPRVIGQTFGAVTVTLGISQIPSHNHPMQVQNVNAARSTVEGSLLAANTTEPLMYTEYTPDLSNRVKDISGVQSAGGDLSGSTQSHENCQPLTAVSFIICLNGAYPQRN